MIKVFICSLLAITTLCAQEKINKKVSFEPAIGYLFMQTIDNTLQQNTTTARGISFNPHLTYFINQQFECGVQPSITIVKSAFTSIESGIGYSMGYLFRYYPQRFIFKETVTGHTKKFVFTGHPYIGFEHDISTIYPDADEKPHFSTHLKTQSFSLSGGVNIYFWRQFYFNISLGVGYNSKLIHNSVYPLGLWSLGYTFQKHK